MQERFALCNVALSQEDVAQTKMLILVVEDEPICALSTVAELEHAGHTTLGPAATLEEGFELARTGHPTLALIDIDLMRAGDGFELARRLRELNIAAVFVSAQHPSAFENRDLALGFIGKPYNPADLPSSIEVIAAVMEGRSFPAASLPRALQLFH
jgi:CheY-like chemotaxis protein